MTRRIAPALALAVAGLLLAATSALAGGWALIQADPGAPQPTAGTEVRIGFEVLQHGQTPIDWATATFSATNANTGQRVTVPAHPEGKTGHYVARVTFPEAGLWTWHVDLAELMTESPPGVITVLSDAGRAPSIDDSTLLAAIEQAKSEVRRDTQVAIGQQFEELQNQVTAQQGEVATLRATVGSLEKERATLAAQVEELRRGPMGEAGGSVPPLAVVTIAALAGAIAGFVISALGRQPRWTPASDATEPAGYPSPTR